MLVDDNTVIPTKKYTSVATKQPIIKSDDNENERPLPRVKSLNMELITLHPELGKLISMRNHSCQNYAMVSSPKAKKYNKILGGGS